MKASFLEVYGADVYDLLAPTERANNHGIATEGRRVLKVKEAKGQVVVDGLKEVELPDVGTALTAVQLGWDSRQSASNGVNDRSSRSHAVLCIKLITTNPDWVRPKVTRMHVVRWGLLALASSGSSWHGTPRLSEDPSDVPLI